MPNYADDQWADSILSDLNEDDLGTSSDEDKDYWAALEAEENENWFLDEEDDEETKDADEDDTEDEYDDFPFEASTGTVTDGPDTADQWLTTHNVSALTEIADVDVAVADVPVASAEDATPAQIREWAINAGVEISARGRISADIRAQYAAAMANASATEPEVLVAETVETSAPAPVTTTESSTQATPAQIREWATARGIEVSARGRISSTVRDMYDAEHSVVTQDGDFGHTDDVRMVIMGTGRGSDIRADIDPLLFNRFLDPKRRPIDFPDIDVESGFVQSARDSFQTYLSRPEETGYDADRLPHRARRILGEVDAMLATDDITHERNQVVQRVLDSVENLSAEAEMLISEVDRLHGILRSMGASTDVPA
jgi:Lsr2